MLVAGSAKELQVMKNDLYLESKKAGMEINISKIKILNNKTDQKPIKIGEIRSEITDNIIYLSQTISFHDQTEKQVKGRIAIAWKKLWSLSHILK